MTDDIPENGASVKSSKATLVNMVLGFDFQSVKAHYMATVHSTRWIWVSHSAEEVTMYEMDKEEFSEFMDMWSSFDKDRKVIRFKAESQKMLRWLEDKVG
jgi:desulfoferrodoxin (superoxide reductase-like protein)